MRDRAAVSVAFCILGGCGDGLFVMHEEFIVQQDESQYLGGACQRIRGGGTSASGVAGGHLPSYSFEVRESDDGARAVLRTSADDLVAEKSYTDDFLRSGKRDELLLELDNQTQVRVVLWGSDVCEPVMELADEE